MRPLPIDKNEVLRILGYRGQELSGELVRLVDNCIRRTEETADPRFCWEVFDCTVQEEAVVLGTLSFTLPGRSLARHLSGCKKVALLAATLGVSFDRLLYRTQNVSMTEAIVLDGCGSVYIEQVCDEAGREILRQHKGPVCSRFSPGYGDLPLSLQEPFLRILDAGRKIGLCCSPESILTPRKSITAIVGFKKPEKSGGLPCDGCGFRDSCRLRQKGRYCGM